MSKFRAALARIADALKLTDALLARAQRRYKANRKRAYVAHRQQRAAQELADRARAKGHQALAAQRDREVRGHAHVAYQNHLRAQHYLGVVKTLQQRLGGLETDHAKVLEEIKRANKVSVRRNKVSGGTARPRVRAAIHAAARNCANGTQHNYYDEYGSLPDLDHTLMGMPYGHRFDCSSFATGIYKCCGLPDPNGGSYTPGETMFTGSLGEHGTRVSEEEANTGDLVLYGPAPHHHVEIVDDPKAKTTVGHGSPPIDAGVFDLFGDGDYEIRRYIITD